MILTTHMVQHKKRIANETDRLRRRWEVTKKVRPGTAKPRCDRTQALHGHSGHSGNCGGLNWVDVSPALISEITADLDSLPRP